MTYRPEGWKNPYTKTGETLGMWALYEAGADAILEGLIKDSKKPVYRDGRKGVRVFIPEEKE